jgi:hypothetical protein
MIHYDRNVAVDDDFEMDGTIGLLQGARAHFDVTEMHDADGPYAKCRLTELTDQQGNTLITRPLLVALWGESAVNRADTYCAEKITVRLEREAAA